jgi:hypothetical protein
LELSTNAESHTRHTLMSFVHVTQLAIAHVSQVPVDDALNPLLHVTHTVAEVGQPRQLASLHGHESLMSEYPNLQVVHTDAFAAHSSQFALAHG